MCEVSKPTEGMMTYERSISVLTVPGGAMGRKYQSCNASNAAPFSEYTNQAYGRSDQHKVCPERIPKLQK